MYLYPITTNYIFVKGWHQHQAQLSTKVNFDYNIALFDTTLLRY